MGEILVLYATETGNSQDLADFIVDKLTRLRQRPVILPFGEASHAAIASASHVFIVASTTGQGALPQNAQPYWHSLLRRGLSTDLYAGVKLASFGLGDSSYPRFNWAVRKIHSRLLQLGATELVERGEGDEQESEGIEAAFGPWLELALNTIKTDLQVTDPIPDTELLPPRFKLEVLTSKMKKVASSDIDTSRTGLGIAKVVENTRITTSDHFQDVRHLALDTSELDYQPGDVAIVYPPNAQMAVDALLECQNWLEIADYPLNIDETWTSKLEGGVVSPLTLRSLFTWHLDLNAIPRRSFFALASHFAKDREQEKMQEFSNGSPDGLQDLYDYANRPRRSLIETITEFYTLKIPLDYILDLFPVLRPRKFSIASAGNQQQVELSVAIVKYRTVLRRIRRGLCTRWIESLQPGEKVAFSLEKTGTDLLGKAANASGVILVATGTGIAPVRSFLHTYRGSAKIILFFGCRYSDKDYLYHDDWRKLEKELDLTVIPAFSREGLGYVQTQIENHGELLKEWIPKSVIFVCGSSGRMPQAVRQAFVDVSQDEDLIASKQKIGTYIQETW